jgi:hypothetical protein
MFQWRHSAKWWMPPNVWSLLRLIILSIFVTTVMHKFTMKWYFLKLHENINSPTDLSTCIGHDQSSITELFEFTIVFSSCTWHTSQTSLNIVFLCPLMHKMPKCTWLPTYSLAVNFIFPEVCSISLQLQFVIDKINIIFFYHYNNSAIHLYDKCRSFNGLFDLTVFACYYVYFYD